MFDKIQSTYFKRVTTGVLALFMTASSGFSYAVPVYAEEVTTASAKRKKEEEFSSTESSTLQLNENSTKEEIKNDQDTGNDDVKVTTNGSSEDQPEVTYEKPDTKEPGRKLSSEEAQKDLKKIIESKKYSYEDILQRIFEIDDFTFYSHLSLDDIKFLMSGKTEEKYEIAELLMYKSVYLYADYEITPKDFYSYLFQYFRFLDECDVKIKEKEREEIEKQLLADINGFYVKDKDNYLKNLDGFLENIIELKEQGRQNICKAYEKAMHNYIFTGKEERDKNDIRSALGLDRTSNSEEKEAAEKVKNDANDFDITGSSELRNSSSSVNAPDNVAYNKGGSFKVIIDESDDGGNTTTGVVTVKGKGSYGEADGELYKILRDRSTTWNCTFSVSGRNYHNMKLNDNNQRDISTDLDNIKVSAKRVAGANKGKTVTRCSYFIMNIVMYFEHSAHYKYDGRSYDQSLNETRFNLYEYAQDGNHNKDSVDTTSISHTGSCGDWINVQINTAKFGIRSYGKKRYLNPSVTIKYKKPTYNVNYYDSVNPNVYATRTVKDTHAASSAGVPSDPTREGYIFKGWANTAGVNPWNKTICGAGENFYAQWEEDTSYQYLDVNGVLDGKQASNTDGMGKFDVYINGQLVSDPAGSIDFYKKYKVGSKYEIKNIRPNSGISYDHASPGLSGTITGYTSVNLYFNTGYTLSVDPNGGTYKGSSGVTTVNNLSPGATITVDSPTRPGYKFGGYEKSNESYQSYASNTGWTTSHGENVGTYSRSYDGNVSLNEAPDGGYYRTNHVWRGIDSATDNYNCISFPTYTAQAGHTYKISGEVWISERPSGGSFALNFYHGDSSNDWKHCMWGISEGWTGKWVKFSMERTFDTTTNDARFEIWTSNLKGLTGNISFWLQGLKITDETTGNDVSMTKIAMGDSDIKLTARWIPLHSTLSYDTQGGSLDSVKSTDNPNNYKIVDNGDYFIQSGLNSSRYLHDYDCSRENGAKVCTFQGYGANAKQCIWTFERYKNTPYYYIINKYNGKALNLSGDGSGTQNGSVEMWTQLDGSNAAQSDFLWYFKDAGDGYITICNKLTDKALDIPNGEDNDNVKLQQYTPNGTASQKFKLVQSEDNYVTTSVVYNGKYLTATGSNNSTGCAFTDKKILWKVRRRGRERYFENEYSDTYTLEDTTTGLKLNAVYHNGMYIIFNNQYDELCYNNGNLWMEYDDDEKDQYSISVQLADADPSSLPSSNISMTLADFPTREKYTDSNVYINSATPVKKGCKFLGWSTSANGNVVYQPGDLYDVNQDGGNVTLYAKWEKAKYTATVKLNGGSYNGSTKDFTISKYPGEEISIGAPTRSKHNFTGYKLTMDNNDGDAPTSVTQSASGFKGIMQMGNFTLNAQWTPWKHTVRYDANAKNDTSVKGIPASQSKTANVDIKLSSDVPTRNGYTFLGWNTQADGKGTAYAAGAIYKNDQNGGTVTLYAQWTPWKHVLHYNKNVPTSSTSQTVSNMPVDQTKTFGQFMAISNLVPTRKGYTFAGWYTQSNGTGTKYNPGSNYAADQNGGTVNLYAKWTPWTYNIKYDQNVKSTSSSKTVTDMPNAQTKTQEIDVTLSSMTPKRNGYIFAGWSTSANGSVEYKPGSRFTKDLDSNGASITLYAVWTPWKHTVHYNSNIPTNAPTGTTTVSNMPGDQTKTFDEKLMISSNKPTRKGYNFAGWSTSANGDVVYQPGAEYKNDQNGGTVTLYAKWTAWKHTVTYDKNVPANSKKTDVKNMPGNQTKIYDQNLTLQSNVPTRIGYTFVKWTTNKDGTGTAYQPGSQYSYNRDSDGGTVTLYAVWTPWKYTVRYDKNVPASSSSQTVSNMPADQTKTEEVNLTLSSNKPSRNGYIFNGWQAQINGKAVDYQPGATLSYDPDVKGSVITLKAKWTAWKHTIHYDKNVPASSSSQTVANMPEDDTKTFDITKTISSTKPSRNGYIFNGWNTQKDGKGTAYASGAEYKHDQNGNTVTLYAQWTPWKHTVTYDKNVDPSSSSQTVTNMPGNQTKTFDEKLMISSTKPSRNGYIFNGWNTQKDGKGTAYASGAEYKHDQNGNTVTLYAQWTAWKHTVHYNANGGDQNSVPTDQTKTFDQAMILSDKKPTRHGYNFVRWNTKADGTGTSYEVKGNYNHDQNGGTVTLYAIWTPWVHTVHYDANGGDQSSVPNDQKKTYGQSMNVATKVPTRNEYKFLGWTTGKDGSGTFYNPGDAYYHDQNGQTVTLYAKWIQLYTVKYDGNQPAIKGVTVTGSVANQTQGQDESVNLQNNNFKNNSGIFKDWSVGQDAYKYAKQGGNFRKYIHPEGYTTKHDTMQKELREYVEGMIRAQN